MNGHASLVVRLALAQGLLASLVASACAHHGRCREDATPESGAASAGALDADLVALAGAAGGAERVKLRVGKAGEVQKVSVYHRDASRISDSVRKAAEAALPGMTDVRYESEWYADRGRVEEVEGRTADGRQCELAGSAGGGTLYTECRIATEAIPAPVRATIDRLVPGGAIEEAEAKQGTGFDEVSAEVRAGTTLHYIRCRPSGELIAHTLLVPAVVEVPAP